MENTRRNFRAWPLFTMGLALGTLAGLVLAWAMLRGFFPTPGPFFDPDAADSTLDVSASSPDLSRQATPTRPTDRTEGDSIAAVDSLADARAMDDSLWLADSLTGSFDDSLDVYRDWVYEPDTLIPEEQRMIPRDVRTAEGDPQVLRDELLFVTEINAMEEVTDSLGKVRLVRQELPIRVEFWESPVNYSGYRKSGNNLVLFGIYAIDSVRLRKSGPNLYMEYLGERYLITETYNYKHLIPLSGKGGIP